MAGTRTQPSHWPHRERQRRDPQPAAGPCQETLRRGRSAVLRTEYGVRGKHMASERGYHCVRFRFRYLNAGANADADATGAAVAAQVAARLRGRGAESCTHARQPRTRSGAFTHSYRDFNHFAFMRSTPSLASSIIGQPWQACFSAVPHSCGIDPGPMRTGASAMSADAAGTTSRANDSNRMPLGLTRRRRGRDGKGLRISGKPLGKANLTGSLNYRRGCR